MKDSENILSNQASLFSIQKIYLDLEPSETSAILDKISSQV